VRGPDGQWLASQGPPIRTLTLAELRRYDIGRLNPASPYARQFPEQRAVDGERFPQLSELFDLGFVGPDSSGRDASAGVGVRINPHLPSERADKSAPTAAPVRFNIETKITPTSGADTPDPATFAKLVVAAVRAADVANRRAVQ